MRDGVLTVRAVRVVVVRRDDGVRSFFGFCPTLFVRAVTTTNQRQRRRVRNGHCVDELVSTKIAEHILRRQFFRLLDACARAEVCRFDVLSSLLFSLMRIWFSLSCSQALALHVGAPMLCSAVRRSLCSLFLLPSFVCCCHGRMMHENICY